MQDKCGEKNIKAHSESLKACFIISLTSQNRNLYMMFCFLQEKNRMKIHKSPLSTFCHPFSCFRDFSKSRMLILSIFCTD